MKRECTDLFHHYREIARLIWNLGFWPHRELREWDGVGVYEEAIARLFEGLILLALGYQGRVEDKSYPGRIAEFRVEINTSDVELMVNKNLPDEPGRLWGKPTIRLNPGNHQLRFMAFFDWYQLAPRDFQLLEVLIERLDDRPEFVGHHGLIELAKCSIWLVTDEDGLPKLATD